MDQKFKDYIVPDKAKIIYHNNGSDNCSGCMFLTKNNDCTLKNRLKYAIKGTFCWDGKNHYIFKSNLSEIFREL